MVIEANKALQTVMSNSLNRTEINRKKLYAGLNMSSISRLQESFNRLQLSTHQFSAAMSYQVSSAYELSSTIRRAFSPVIQSLAENQRALNITLASIAETTSKLNRATSITMDQILTSNRAASKTIESFSNNYRAVFAPLNNLTENLGTSRINELISSIGSIMSEPGVDITSIDFSDVDDLDLQEQPQLNVGSSNLSATVTVVRPKKKLSDITDGDIKNLLKKCVNRVGAFSFLTYVYHLYSDYVDEAARIMIEIMIVVVVSLVSGHFDSNVKAAIKERVTESTTVKDLRKVITRYVKVNPYGQIGFARKDSYIREGASKHSRIVTSSKITTKTPLSIIERRNNWLKVEIDDGENRGEIGWIEESKVIKYKRIEN